MKTLDPNTSTATIQCHNCSTGNDVSFATLHYRLSHQCHECEEEFVPDTDDRLTALYDFVSEALCP